MYEKNLLLTIGSTPLVDVSVLSPNPNVCLYAKLENQNPAGSIKDRVALGMITKAEREGTLSPGATIMEPSSGNTGIALAMIAQMRGYHMKVILPENVSVERTQLLGVFGAEIIWSPAGEGSNGAVRRAEKMSSQNPDWVFLHQYANDANPQAHYDTTGPEIWRDCPQVTHFVAGLGTSGTLMGVGTYLKNKNSAIRVLAVEPPVGEQVDGLRSLEEGYIPPIYERWGGNHVLDGKRIVRLKESVYWTQELTKTTGIFGGVSTGAILAGVIRVAEKIKEGNIVFVVCDGGWKYLSTGAWTEPAEDVMQKMGATIYF